MSDNKFAAGMKCARFMYLRRGRRRKRNLIEIIVTNLGYANKRTKVCYYLNETRIYIMRLVLGKLLKVYLIRKHSYFSANG